MNQIEEEVEESNMIFDLAPNVKTESHIDEQDEDEDDANSYAVEEPEPLLPPVIKMKRSEPSNLLHNFIRISKV